MKCKVCNNDLDEHDFYRLETCLGYLKLELEKINYGMERSSGTEEEDEETDTKIIEATHRVLGFYNAIESEFEK